MPFAPPQLDRARGAVLASAVGDALGSQSEFGPPLSDATPVSYGVGVFGHGVGEWTDDTSMAMPILQALAAGESLNDAHVLAQIVVAWREWARDAKDVGAQTRTVLSALEGDVTEDRARGAARDVHVRAGRSGGNGALMRTGPVALGYLADGQERDLVDAATHIAQLTHWEDDNADACVLWCLSIRHAILTGELDVLGQLDVLPSERRDRWRGFTEEALAPGAHPRDFSEQNGWVVRAFQGALAAIAGATSAVDALERAVRGGNDTDTVAAIAGSLAGAVFGADALPPALVDPVHGWPRLHAVDLITLSDSAVLKRSA
ncbi:MULTISPECIES: ADP-ribosylglycohydrolase family protein [unclassified Pseudoclavibacter]|uniref:ADP-ribosylglycohydrolase family protein n=1 Tax=unclassified Pseudoclavibacter TaxID=2615177 RepID=UPI001BA4E946|nr:ADP-ribosylglycohydrolase family protein [Pseudoclavibacter sp. Marseille-Q4354]MBS3179889.1 ADP-ribosylglycohydrolase family protein [Pseudoclavibacter sp. Marseille-Q4354]